MKTQGESKGDSLLKRAENILSQKPQDVRKVPVASIKRLIHELDVHQIELDMQNDELRRSQAEIEKSRSKYVDLYDFAPVGYFTFTHSEKLVEVNLTGAKLLGIERSRLLGRPFSLIVAPEFRSVFRRHCSDVLKGGNRERCELKLIKKDGTFFHAQLESIRVDGNKKNSTWIRSAISDITERKKAEEDLSERTAELEAASNRLQEAEQKSRLQLAELETIYNSAPVGLCVFDPQLTYLRINKRMAEMYGIHARDLIGRTPRKVVPAITDQAEALLRQIIEAGKPILNVEINSETPAQTGIHRTWLEHWLPLKDSAGNIVAINVVAEEITERKRMEEALLKSEETLRAFFNAGIHQRSILELREDDIVYKLPNQNTAAFFGLTVEEMTGKSLKGLGVREEAIRFWLEQFRRCRKTGETTSLEYVFPYKGRKPWFRCSFTPLRLPNGQSSLFRFVALEITDLKHAELLSKALNDINSHVNSGLEYDEMMQSVVTEAGRTIGCETAAISLKKDDRWILSYVYGLSKEWVGTEVVDEEEPLAMLALKTKKPIAIEDVYNDERVNRKHVDKYGIRSLLLAPMLAGNEPVGVIFFNYQNPTTFSAIQVDFCLKLASSISFAIRNAQLAKEVKLHAEELENANKELESFAYSVSHDLKAPLIVASGFSRRLSEVYGEKLDDKGRHYLQRLQEACQQMNLLIEDLLKLSKMTASRIKFESIDLSDLVKSIATQLKETQPEREAKFLIEEGLTAKGDSHFLKIGLENLLGNAWKFTGKRKRAKIEFGLAKRFGDEPTYFVRDNGCGFDMSMADKLFKPFQRLHEDGEFSGTGVGLATVHRIITRHGGRIWAESVVDKGTTLFFTLSS